MKVLPFVSALYLFAGFVTSSAAQDSFSSCAVAFHNGDMIVSEYSPSGKSVLSHSATGSLTVYTAELTEAGARLVDPVAFFVAMRDAETGTLLMLTPKPAISFELSELLQACSSGDRLVLISTEDSISLPHNEIVVE